MGSLGRRDRGFDLGRLGFGRGRSSEGGQNSMVMVKSFENVSDRAQQQTDVQLLQQTVGER
jgi:hypothetical protein